ENLAAAPDGNFYGTTYWDGAKGLGSIIRVTADGAVTTFLSFNGLNGERSMSSQLFLARDGNLYGTTIAGGINGGGTVFRLVFRPSLSARISADQVVLT